MTNTTTSSKTQARYGDAPMKQQHLATAGRMLARNHIWLFLLLAIATFSLASPYFLTVNNLSNVLTQSAFIGILAVGMTLVMINGEIDLSVGAILALASALAIGLQPHIGVWPAVFVALLSGTALGLLNGTLVVLSGMHSFIVTLGGLIGIRGLVFIYTGENALMVEDFTYTEYPEMYLGPISITAIIFLGLTFALQWMLSHTRHGRETYAIGDNIEAAHEAGIRVKRHKVINFVICGTLAAIAGILLSMRLGTAEPNAGKIWELWAIIAVVLGGTRLQGGYGSLWKTLGGILTLAVLQNGLRLLNTPNYIELMVMGSVLVLALLLDRVMLTRT
ncbi:ABC transporter permease [Grimontia hollisae]|uniref:Ribose ABC transport system permease protein RbsC n=1 Tax=Grimontia hollisae CIP 101886 TaxID=675812 RepID=D0I785_GRIHO|nr:ABC transporter permease [Grimontia hollisae]EEY72504.1 ribose ABC transport system permease protein RbsC [Grimontia hollisae CIP 101886]STO45945.1 Ribose transport system permease protein rbsC [Grimontia hollisae]